MLLHKTFSCFLKSIQGYRAKRQAEKHPRFYYQNDRVIKSPNKSPKELPFSQYVSETKEKLTIALEPFFKKSNPFIYNLTLEEVVNCRSPEEIMPSSPVGESRMGFLFLHALTDTPYSGKTLRESILPHFPNATYRSVLLPGHGTLPGDSKEVDYREWVATAKYGIDSFRGEVDELYLIGYSTGYTLAIHYLQEIEQVKSNKKLEQKSQAKLPPIKGVIGLSPALRAMSPLARITPWFSKKWFPFLDVFPDTNPMKYESFSLNFARQFYFLTKSVHIDTLKNGVKTPLFMAVTSDDDTVDPVINRQFFCRSTRRRFDTGLKTFNKMIWYQGYQNQLKNSLLNDLSRDYIEVRRSDFFQYGHKNLSHSSLVFPANQPFYGYQQCHHDCRTYYELPTPPKEYYACQNFSNKIIYGENNLLKLINFPEGTYYQRSTMNPDYKHLVEEMIEFIKTASLN